MKIGRKTADAVRNVIIYVEDGEMVSQSDVVSDAVVKMFGGNLFCYVDPLYGCFVSQLIIMVISAG